MEPVAVGAASELIWREIFIVGTLGAPFREAFFFVLFCLTIM
jgi:hypothetical protein